MIWLLNLMNTNDRRGRIEVRDIFKKTGEFKDGGEELLTRKSTGYISFVRGENPYTFPYRVYPIEFAKEHTFPAIKYPSYQMNLKKIKHEDKKRVLSLYLTKIGECGNCGKCQYCAYKYIIYNLRNKKFSITTKTGIVRDMPNFENMESFGYTLLQTPLESLIISYPIQGLKSAIDEMPQESLSEDFSQSFSESISLENENEEDEAPGPIEGEAKTLSVKSSFSERKDSEEPEEVESESEEFIMKPNIKKPLIIEDSDDDTDELFKINKTAIDSNIEKKDSDDDTDELKKELIRKERQKIKTKKPLIIEDSSSSNKSETKEKSKTVTIKKPTMQVEISDNEESSKTLVDNSNGTLVDNSNGTLVDNSNGTLVDSSNGTLVDSSNEKSPTNDDTTKGGKGPSIDPHQLTGKIGLERMMNYVDEKSPPVKGDFEYKKSTLDQYGKIFSREHIGKYSSKIKSILDNIVNEETEKVSDGVILIYSQYIDSGLIPMALALEEMGFTRYGQGVKPLFKNKPSEVVDVTTMKPPADKKKFMPARYAMITGETRLSPNNDFEVKGLTGEDNKDGHKIKVVLISKAGSEGIDLKFIRQVHILEPWYNMNRIEQIIGRAVRNFSHKDLPFEKRNVEIFMYGTILGDNKEEAADLYVYRVAEYKAIQIGKVTRVLKETAVDCIINHDQTNFTQENISKNLKEPIKQILSNGTELNNFKIGDAPFSPACDYMAECNYDCRPDKDIDLKDLNKDTYNENFIVVNSEKILQRIRMLMKESYFYKKDVLIRSIRTPKEYPYVQIYSALTQLIEDENEFITDKYGRNGRLVNIGDYYLFQPVELRDKNASMFDRSTPIDYKHEMINFEIKQNIVKPVIDKRNINKFILEEEEEVSFPEGNRLINEMKVNFDISREFAKQPKVARGDDNWYKHCGIVMKKMTREYPDSKEYIISYLVAHMMELLLFEEKLDVMNYLYSLETITKNTFEWFAKEYFEQNIIKTKNFTAFIMYKLNKRMIMILNKSDKWVEAEPEDQREIAASKETKEFLTMKPEDYNRIVGFIGYEKSNRYLVFKTKDMLSKRDTGARCDESGKVKTLQKINEILGENKYTNENTKAEKDSDGNVIREAVGHVELCVLQEFLLRYFNTIKREDKKWFISPEMAIWHKLYTVFA
jgi:hypothetical protein